MTFYLKYRPQKISDLDIETVRGAIKKMVKSSNIPHALLFSGPKGTGKTSAARILAKAINCQSFNKKQSEPCGKCSQCELIAKGDNIDVIELDAASHRGIDDVRVLRDAVKLSPAKANSKVYIIDEAHMLTTEASNALLKTLEEPPEHVYFILATTNPEKLIATIRSRSTNIHFRKAKDNEVVSSLEKVIKGEKIKAEGKVLEVIAKNARGSFRDGVKILEQLVSEKVKLEKDEVEKYLTFLESFDVDRFFSYIYEKDAKAAITEIENAVEKGALVKNISESIIEKLKNFLFLLVGIEEGDYLKFSVQEVVELINIFTKASSQIKDFPIEQIPLEVAVVEFLKEDLSSDNQDDQPGSSGGKAVNKNKSSNGIKSKKEDKDETVNHKVSNGTSNRSNGGSGEVIIQKSVSGGQISEQIWIKVLDEVKPKNYSTEALLRASRPIEFDGKTLKLGVFYSFHKEKLESNPHRMLLEDILSSIIGERVRVECMLTKPPEKKTTEEEDDAKEEKNEMTGEPDLVLTEGDDKDIIKVAEEIFGS